MDVDRGDVPIGAGAELARPRCREQREVIASGPGTAIGKPRPRSARLGVERGLILPLTTSGPPRQNKLC